MDALKIFEESKCIATQDLEFLKETLPKIQENWEKKQMFRTRTEMEISVLNDFKHPTKASKYWQAVREQSVFYQELVRLSFDYRRNEIEIKKLEKQISVKKDPLERELLQIDLEEKLFGRINMEETSKHRIREIKSWQEILDTLDDGTFDTNDVNTHQLDSYTRAFANKVQTVNANTPPADASNIVGLHLAAQKAQKEGLALSGEEQKRLN